MNNAQTIFTLFYGVYFAATVPMTGIFRPFDTPAMYDLQYHAWLRFFASFAILNVFPVVYFVVVFNLLSTNKSFKVTVGSMLALLVLSLGGFGFYRIYFGTMLLRDPSGYLFYGQELPKQLDIALDDRPPIQRQVLPHVITGIIWVAICLGVGLTWSCFQNR